MKRALVSGALALSLFGGTGLGLVACGTTAPAKPPTLAQVAKNYGATNVEPIDPTMFAKEEAGARWHGKDIDLVVFNTPQAKANWKRLAVTEFGATVLFEGPLYIAVSD